MQLTPQEAAAALAEVDGARLKMRRAIRAHRGHYHLWIWGATWIVMPMTAQIWGDQTARYFGLMCIVSGIASAIVGLTQSHQIKAPVNLRLIGVFATVFVFGALSPFVLGGASDSKAYYAHACLVAMQIYVIAGLWTDTYLLWVGLFVTALILIGIFLLPGIFWLWMAGCGGGSLLLTGFYVRHFWR